MTAARPDPSGFLPVRTVHLHLTRRCNLSCRHCYSESGPATAGTLDLARLIGALPHIRAAGYDCLSLSGGEPLLYRSLPEFIQAAREADLRVTLITNGTLPWARVQSVRAQVDGMAVSFDGLQATHDATRGRTGTYWQALDTVRRLADAGLPAAAAVSLLPGTLPELPDLVGELQEAGVAGVQVRPVAPAGRARHLPDGTGWPADRARLFWTTLALAQEHAPLPITSDLAPAQLLLAQRDAFDALARWEDGTPLSAAVNPLVVTAEGILKPFTYDFHTQFDLGSLETIARPHLAVLTRLSVLIDDLFSQLQSRFDVLDWYAECAAASQDAARRRLGTQAGHGAVTHPGAP
ncbi:radical SAM protein [Deinococcus sp. JMULE3]|uniref:radical SAM protein n=1 Tax=Deinococcus sp. JMULE3 TaxID=2518341 RepID=UPI001575694A